MRDDLLVWIDLEMTGLDTETCSIIEIATVITDTDLNIIAEGPNLAIQCSEEKIQAMDEWCTTHHNASGLVQRVRESKYSLQDTQALTLDFIKQYCTEGSAPLCGNSISTDRRFLIKEMPELEAYLHYRILDVSSFKIIAGQWYPEVARFEKKEAHLARDDILESIGELKHYREFIFKQS
jgi:oligoribonuclease